MQVALKDPLLIAPTRQKLEKIANLLADGFNTEDIATVVSYPVETVMSIIENNHEFKRIMLNKRAQQIKADKELDDGWDSVERNAIGQITSYLNDANDPEYALQAGRLAMQARALDAKMRMKHVHNRELDAHQGRGRVVIGINNNMVGRIMVTENGEKPKVINGPQKTTNVLEPRKLENVFGGLGGHAEHREFDQLLTVDME